MAIQSTQVPIYTTTHCFCIFFSIFFYEKQIMQKLKSNQAKHKRNIQNIKLDWLKTRKQNKQVMHNHMGERKKNWLNHFEPFSFHTLKEHFLCANLWSGGEGEELKLFKFERNMRALRRSPRGVKKDGNWFWFLDESILLLCWVANHL